MFALLLLLGALASVRAALAPVVVLTVDGAIGPASADYIVRGIERAEDTSAQLVILRMDTPGGLDLSMRSIIKAILASDVPVATFVAPSGARAASAGTYILYASHIAAMAPGTNLGAATPVQIGGAPQQPEPEPLRPAPDKDKPAAKGGETEEPPGEPTTSPSTRKQINDAAAYIRGLADLRDRNAEWGERAVREAVSLTANEALQQNVIDLVATDIPDLLRELDGRKLMVDGKEVILQTAGASVIEQEADWRTKFLSVITDPSVALILMTVGMYGLVMEFMNPGIGIPGVLGGICLLLALYALQLLPVNYAGLGLIVLGLAFMVAEAFVPSFGALGLGGIIAFVTGAVILIDTDVPGFGIPLALIGGMAVAAAILVAITIGVVLKTRRRPVITGKGELIGNIGEVVNVTPEKVWVHLAGENWQAQSRSPLQRGQKVRVLARHGLVLDVTPIDNQGE